MDSKRKLQGAIDISDFPVRLSGDMAWAPDEFGHDSSYTLELEDHHIEELEHGMELFKGLGLDGDCICPDNFPLPMLEHLLADLSTDIHTGKGFCVLRGLDPSRYTAEDNILLFLGISSYIGARRGRQSCWGEMITHITDPKCSTIPQAQRRLVHTQLPINFHNDVLCDVLAIQTLGSAFEGGMSYLASSWTIYNALVSSRPDIIDVLAQPDWPVFDAALNPPFQLRPMLFYHEERIILNVSEVHLKMDPHFRQQHRIPNLSELQSEALDLVLATAQKYSLKMETQLGDIRYINNLGILHAREAYKDDHRSSRHLVRLYLRNDDVGWDIPPMLRETWDRVYGRNGLLDEIYPIEPVPIIAPPIYRFGN